MSWTFNLARSWESAYGEKLPALREFAQRYGSRQPDWNACCEQPPVLGMQLRYDLAPTMEDFLAAWHGRRGIRRVDLVPFSFDIGDERAYELANGWLILSAACVTDGSRYSYDEAHAARVDALAPRFQGGLPGDDEGWEIVNAAFEKRMFELAHAAYETQLPVVVSF